MKKFIFEYLFAFKSVFFEYFFSFLAMVFLAMIVTIISTAHLFSLVPHKVATVPAKVPAISVTDLLHCNREARVFVPKPEKPPAPESKQETVRDMKIGEDGYVVGVFSVKGKLYDQYIDGVYKIPGGIEDTHIMRTKDGLLIDCTTPNFIYPQDDLNLNHSLPVVGTFHK
jgi:signal peptidase I